MQVVAVLVAAACFSLSVEAQNVICGPKTTTKSVTVEDKQTYSFKTQKGKKYKGGTTCTVDYKMGDSCTKMSFVCKKFNINNKDKKKCTKGDKVTVTVNGKPKVYCKTKKPKVFSTGDMSVVFESDKKKHGPGAVCKVKCTEAATSATTEGTGVIITGGEHMTSTELYLPRTGKTCSLGALPEKRYRHSLNTVSKKIILCGGQYSAYTQTSCIEFLPTSSKGSWVNVATLAQHRYYHTTHRFKGNLLIMGGQPKRSKGTTEIVGKGMQYNLLQDSFGACSIPDRSATILTGGYNSGSGVLQTVMRYDMQGFVSNLPDLATARYSHGCGFYSDSGNNKVLVVAGGSKLTSPWLSSTEILKPGAPSWTSGSSLPRVLIATASVSMGAHLLFIGGFSDGPRGEILKFNGTWTEVGRMQIKRHAAAATKIKLNTNNKLDLTGCH